MKPIGVSKPEEPQNEHGAKKYTRKNVAVITAG